MGPQAHPFIGRAEDLAILGDQLRLALGGEGRCLLIGGEAGIGKSRLVRECLATPEMSESIVATGECLDLAPPGIPFLAFREVLRQLEAATGSAAARRALDLLAPGSGGVGEGPTLDDPSIKSRLFDAVLDAFQEVAGVEGLVVVLEDLHWSDRSSLDLIAYLISSLKDERVLVVATYRTDELTREHQLKAWLSQRIRQERVEAIELPNLSFEDIGSLLTAHGADASDISESIFERSEGNPFLAEELLAARSSSGDKLPPVLRDVMTHRFEGLSEESHRILRALATAVQPPTETVLSDVTGLERDALFAGLRELLDRNILSETDAGSGYRFRHALLKEAAEHDLLPGERADLHRAFARALERGLEDRNDPVMLAEIADHYFKAHEQSTALVSALAAADAELASFAFPEAASHYGRVLELWKRAPDAAASTGIHEIDVLERAGRASHLASDGRRAVTFLQRAVERAAEDAGPAQQARLLGILGECCWTAGFGDLAGASFTEALAVLPDDAPPVLRAQVLVAAALHAALFTGGDKAWEMAEESLTIARSIGAGRIESKALNVMGVSLGAEDRREEAVDLLRQAVEVAERNQDSEELVRIQLNLGEELFRLGKHEEAVEVSLEGARTANVRGHVERGSLKSNASEFLFFMGRWDEAILLAKAVLRKPSTWARCVSGLVLASADVRRGEIRATTERLSQVADDVAQIPVMHSGLGEVQAELAILEGRSADGIESIRDLLKGSGTKLDRRDTAHLVARGLMACAETAAEATAGDELRTQALKAADELLQIAAGSGFTPDDGGLEPQALGWAASCDAELSRLRANGGSRPWAKAADRWRDLGNPYEEAYCLWRLAEADLTARVSRTGAVAALRRAHAIATDLRAIPLQNNIETLARRARIEFVQPAEPPDSVEAGDGSSARDAEISRLGLTDREAEVLTHVARGLSNRKIAEVLFISPKTASVHVSNILRKMDARSRVEAASMAHKIGLVGD